VLNYTFSSKSVDITS